MDAVSIISWLIMSALIALIGRNRSCGYGISFALCLLLSPLIGLIIILCCKKNSTKEYVDMNKEGGNK